MTLREVIEDKYPDNVSGKGVIGCPYWYTLFPYAPTLCTDGGISKYGTTDNMCRRCWAQDYKHEYAEEAK